MRSVSTDIIKTCKSQKDEHDIHAARYRNTIRSVEKEIACLSPHKW